MGSFPLSSVIQLGKMSISGWLMPMVLCVQEVCLDPEAELSLPTWIAFVTLWICLSVWTCRIGARCTATRVSRAYT